MTAVFDAGALVVPLLSDDELRAAARRLRGHVAAHYGVGAPALAAWELGNIVHKKFSSRLGRSEIQRATVVADLLAEVELAPPTTPSLRRCGRLTEKHGLSFYDASYLELAARDEVSFLVTEDAHLLRIGAQVLGPGRSYDTLDALRAVDDAEL